MLFTADEIPQQPQAQYSLTQQLSELRLAARRLGLYDAEDWLARQDVQLHDLDTPSHIDLLEALNR